jgi:hypothetical protein
MKKRPLKLPNKILIASSLVFLFFFVRAADLVLGRIEVGAEPRKKASGPARPPADSAAFPVINSALFEKIQTRNIFLAAMAKTGASSAKEASLRPLGKNEIRDSASGTVFVFLGVLYEGEKQYSFFVRSGPPAAGEKKYRILQRGDSLSPSWRVRDMGEKWVKLAGETEETELKLFSVEIIDLDSAKKADKKSENQKKRDRQ